MQSIKSLGLSWFVQILWMAVNRGNLQEKQRIVISIIDSYKLQSVDVLVLQAFVLQHVVNLLGSGGTLQFLSVEHFLLELLNCLTRADESLRYTTITTACKNQMI